MSRGFTLLELLVAMTLLALLVAALAGGLRFGSRAWETGESRLEHLERMLITHGFLRRQIGRAYPLPERERGTVDFLGQPERLSFVGLMPEHLGAGELQRLTLEVVAGDGRRDLMLLWEPLRAGVAEPYRTVLVEDVAEARFAYRGPRADETGEPPWREDWQEMTKLPTLVRLQIRFRNGDRRQFPDLVARPILNDAPTGAARATRR
jgi:general secretion pathway protein J